MKGIAKYGFKSGVLPKPRQIVPRVKTRFELEEAAKIPTGFSDPAMVPKGSPANPPGRQERSAAEKIALSAKASAKQTTPKSEQHRWRQQSSEVRRKYLIDSLESEAALEQKRAERRERRHEEALKLRQQMSELGDSRVAQLTMPTIEKSLLAGTMVLPRTAEETRLLKLKREANYKQLKAQHLEKQSNTLLELYQQTGSFIISEEELDRAVDREFMSERVDKWKLPIRKQDVEKEALKKTDGAFQSELVNTLTGTVGPVGDAKPGLGQARDALDGSWKEWTKNNA